MAGEAIIRYNGWVRVNVTFGAMGKWENSLSLPKNLTRQSQISFHCYINVFKNIIFATYCFITRKSYLIKKIAVIINKHQSHLPETNTSSCKN